MRPKTFQCVVKLRRSLSTQNLSYAHRCVILPSA